jgi:hypothetical protein
MDTVAISVIAVAGVIGVLIIAAVAWMSRRTRAPVYEEPSLDVLMRYAMRRRAPGGFPTHRTGLGQESGPSSVVAPQPDSHSVGLNYTVPSELERPPEPSAPSPATAPEAPVDELPPAIETPNDTAGSGARIEIEVKECSQLDGDAKAHKPDVGSPQEPSVVTAEVEAAPPETERKDRPDGDHPAMEGAAAVSRQVAPHDVEECETENAAPNDFPLPLDGAPYESPNEKAPARPLTKPRRRKGAVHRDRRGSKRYVGSDEAPSIAGAEKPSPAIRLPGEVGLRLALHPIQQTARLSLVLSRPEGFPERTAIEVDGKEVEFGRFDENRYDDIDVEWRPELLGGELRYQSNDGCQWVRSARRIHIFCADPNEPDLLSVSAASLGVSHTIVCRLDDATAVEAVTASAQSPALTRHGHWEGIPESWCVLSGYVPAHAAAELPDQSLRPLDPGINFKILLAGGLAVRPDAFAQGHPPRIEIPELPDGVSVTIAGKTASLGSSGGWEAEGWDSPGPHVVDVTPGPSLTYEIVADPALGAGWEPWDAHEKRFPGSEPWARVRVCGAGLSGPHGEAVVACETRSSLIALSPRQQAVWLQPRAEMNVSVGLLPEAPEFLIASWGQRRHQGTVIWLGLYVGAPARASAKKPDTGWANIVRNAASRRLPVVGSDGDSAVTAWRKTVRRARNVKRGRA